MDTQHGSRGSGPSNPNSDPRNGNGSGAKRGVGPGWASVIILVLLSVLVMAGLLLTGTGPNGSSVARNAGGAEIDANPAPAPAERLEQRASIDEREPIEDREPPDAADDSRGAAVALPDDLAGQYALGLALRKEGRLDEAEGAFRAALALDPRCAKCLTNLARVLLDENRAADAVVLVNRAAALAPESGDAHRVRGRVLHTLGVIDGAIESYARALEIDGRDVWALNNLGLVLIESGRFEEAIAPLARATRADSGVAVFQNNLGIALERTGRNRAAAEAYARAVAVDRSHGKAAENLARASALRDDPSARPLDLAALGDAFDAGTVAARPATGSDSTVARVGAIFEEGPPSDLEKSESESESEAEGSDPR